MKPVSLCSCVCVFRFDTSSVASVLSDKSHLEGTRERYRAYQIQTPSWDYLSEEQAATLGAESGMGMANGMLGAEPGFEMLYDDEYDDTYDSQNVGAADDATDEQFVVKR